MKISVLDGTKESSAKKLAAEVGQITLYQLFYNGNLGTTLDNWGYSKLFKMTRMRKSCLNPYKQNKLIGLSVAGI
ncbi:hypothetical protein, partial [Neisseria iguanae]